MLQLKWYACELHCHTVHSDGKFTVKGLLQAAKNRYLDGICLTDHNTKSGIEEITEISSPVVLCGMEWTTFFGHMLVLDCKKFVEWRDATPNTIDDKMCAVKNENGLVGVAHPFQLGTPICTGGHWDFNVRDWNYVDYIEVWSEGNPFLNYANIRAINMWHSLLDKGYHIAATFGRDWHSEIDNNYPTACTYLGSFSEKFSKSDIKDAIKNGRTVVSIGPLFYMKTDDDKTVGDTVISGDKNIHFIIDTKRMNNFENKTKIIPKTIRLITNGEKKIYETKVTDKMQVTRISFKKGNWYSAELWGQVDDSKETLIAITSPIYTQ